MDNSSQTFQSSHNDDEDDENLLTLRLWTGPRSPPSPMLTSLPSSSTSSPMLTSTQLPLGIQIIPLSPSPRPPQDFIFQPVVPNIQAPSLSIYPNHESHMAAGLDLNDNAVSTEIVSHSRPPRPRRNTSQTLKQGKSKTIPQPFPWASDQRATVHSLDYLLSHNITTISGEVHCKRCDKVYTIKYDLLQKFREISDFIKENKFSLHDRAPSEWKNPDLPSCESCGSCVRPVLKKKRSINWLFLLLGKMLGCCKLSELQYFCEHTDNHKTGAKDRVLYLTYLGLCKQLDPTGPFDI